MRLVLCVPVISAGMIGAALAIGSSPVVAADCLAEPNRDTPPGHHWYFRVDHADDRKCWYLREEPAGAAAAPAMEVRPLRRQAAPAPAAVLPRREVAVPGRSAPRSEADEAALYLEFLRWKEQHRGAVAHPRSPAGAEVALTPHGGPR